MQNHQPKILIVDDDLERATQWCEELKSHTYGSSSTVLNNNEVLELLQIVEERRKAVRTKNDIYNIDCVLDDFDILIVDYDLQDLSQTGHWATGIQIATLARALSKVKTIVLVNQFGTNSFDLRMTQTQNSPADFDVGSAQLTNPSLWDTASNPSCVPWTWHTDLVLRPSQFSETCEWISQNFNQPVLQSIGFANTIEGDNEGTFIAESDWPSGLNGPHCTFKQLVENSDFLPLKDRLDIASLPECSTRIAAAIVLGWIDRMVVPSQEILIDVPHLISYYPWLLKDNTSLDNWHKAAS